MEDQTQQTQPVSNREKHFGKFGFVVGIMLLILLSAGIGYIFGEKAGEKSIQPSLRTPSTMPSRPVFTITPTQASTLCQPAPEEGDQSQTYIWKTYTCRSLGVSFQYPTNSKPTSDGNVVTGFNNYVQIGYGLDYIFRITHFTTSQSLSDWWKQHSDNPNLSSIVTQTTFHGYSAYSVKETPTTMQSVQVPEDEYIVKVSPTTLYDIEYAVPDPRSPQSLQETELLTTGMQKILDSLTFFPAQ